MSRPADAQAAASASSGSLKAAPPAMQRLLRLVARAFYSPSVALALDIIVGERCVKEADLAALLQFDKKEFSATVATIEKDKLARYREQVDPNEVQAAVPDKKPTQHKYWFVDWKESFEAVRYRLMRLRKRVDDATKFTANPKSYHCPDCHRTYGDLDFARLIDFTTNTMRCEDSWCGAELVRDETSARDAITSGRDKIARLNEQMGPLYKLINECENVVLHESLRNPDISVKNLQTIKGAVTNRARREDPNRRKAAQEQAVVLQPAKVEIEFADDEAGHSEARQRPKWLQTSTVEDAHGLTSAVNAEVKPEMEEPGPSAAAAAGAGHDAARRRMAEDLLNAATTARTGASADQPIMVAVTPAPAPAPEEEEDEEEGGESDMESVEEEAVMLNGARVPVSEVTDEQKGAMTDAELEEFTEKYQAYLDRMGM